MLTKAAAFQLFFGVATAIIFSIINLKYGIIFFAIHSALNPQSQDEIFPLTYSLAIISVVAISIFYRKHGIISVWYGFSVAFLWVIIFEILWQNSFIISGGFHDTFSRELILFSWLLLGFNSYPIWKKDKISIIALILFALGWTSWVVSGYQQIDTLEGLVFNLFLKIQAFLTIMVIVSPRSARLFLKKHGFEMTVDYTKHE
ncbi:MAG: hypothetical protein QXU18_14625 [Thermoplasmatales archaeon]